MTIAITGATGFVGRVVVPLLLAQGHCGETLRLALLSAHYRSPLPWTETLVEQSKTILDRWYRGLQRFAMDYEVADYDPHPSVIDALSDDLNTPAAISVLNAGLREIAGDGTSDLQVFSIDTETGSWFAAARRSIATRPTRATTSPIR